VKRSDNIFHSHSRFLPLAFPGDRHSDAAPDALSQRQVVGHVPGRSSVFMPNTPLTPDDGSLVHRNEIVAGKGTASGNAKERKE
jgi:hypothetical protein